MNTATSLEPQVVLQRTTFDLMRQFHHERVEQIVSGELRLHQNSGDDLLLVHFLPEEVFSEYRLIDSSLLKKAGARIPPLGGRGGHGRFNTDGFLNHDGRESVKAYTLLYRDGRAECLMPSIRYSMNQTSKEQGPFAIRDSWIEDGVLKTTNAYLKATEQLGLLSTIWLFSSIIGCRDVHICTDHSFRDLSEQKMDRSPCFLPPMRLDKMAPKIGSIVRPWSDCFWQAFGMERSFNFDENDDFRDERFH